jgi:hypothetical protein
MPTAPPTSETTVRLDPAWRGFMGPHGGYLAALLVGAALDAAPSDHACQALSVSFLSAPDHEHEPVRTRVLRRSRSTVVLTAELGSATGPAAMATVTTARPTGSGPCLAVHPPPAAPPDQVAPEEVPAEFVPFVRNLEWRPVGDSRPFAEGPQPVLTSWLRFVDGRTVGAAAAAILLDALPPGLYATLAAPRLVPTVDLQAVFTTEPYTGWVLARIATRWAGRGWCVDESDLWAPDGTHLAQARQTRRVLGELQ